MNKLVTWAFIFLSKGCNANINHTILNHCGNTLLVYGVNTIEEAVEISKDIVDKKGRTLIELCGGFKREGAAIIRASVGEKALVGFIDYFKEDLQRLYDFM